METYISTNMHAYLDSNSIAWESVSEIRELALSAWIGKGCQRSSGANLILGRFDFDGDFNRKESKRSQFIDPF